MKLETRLIENCAPTLAGLKCASLFNYFHEDKQIVLKELENVNKMLNKKGVNVEILIWREHSALVYVYRKTMLERNLKQSEVIDLLEKYGYESCEIDSCLEHLKQKILHSSCFPHEIGIFLGYPLEDVKGFIENKGQNCESCGIWKVYCNKEEKEKLFQKYKKCQEVYLQVFYDGRKLSQMTVCT